MRVMGGLSHIMLNRKYPCLVQCLDFSSIATLVGFTRAELHNDMIMSYLIGLIKLDPFYLRFLGVFLAYGLSDQPRLIAENISDT